MNMSMKLHTLTNFVDHDTIQRARQEVDRLQLQRYDNPFERKWFVQDKAQTMTGCLGYIFNELRSSETCRWVSRILGVPLEHSDFSHYGGLFKYDQGDYLQPHVDAGIHPLNGYRKVATALLYLTPAQLAVYGGDKCTAPYPEVWIPTLYNFNANDLILFANTDQAWHAVPPISGTQSRIVLTVSYLALPTFSDMQFQNPRSRAYFAHIVGQYETQQIKELRDKRASEEHHSEVYRT